MAKMGLSRGQEIQKRMPFYCEKQQSEEMMFSSNIFRLTCAREDLVVSSQEKHLYSLLNKIFSIEGRWSFFSDHAAIF